MIPQLEVERLGDADAERPSGSIAGDDLADPPVRDGATLRDLGVGQAALLYLGYQPLGELAVSH